MDIDILKEILFIKQYYILLYLYFAVIIILSFFNGIKSNSFKIIGNVSILFGIYIGYYIGSRPIDIGIDTANYQYIFYYDGLEGTGDVFFRYLNLFFNKYFSFESYLIVCGLLYTMCPLIAFRILFKEKFFLAYILFLISPYFMQMGINVMRNGIAASIFLIFLASVYKRNSTKFNSLFFLSSIFTHLSLLIVGIVFYFSKYFNYIKLLFVIWTVAIVFSLLKLNFVGKLIAVLPLVGPRFGNYVNNYSENVSWNSFLIYGISPVFLAMYFILYKRFEDVFYNKIVATYLVVHICYVFLIHMKFAERVGYLAEFMMPLLIIFPLIKGAININKIRFFEFKFIVIVFLLFVIKSIKIIFI